MVTAIEIGLVVLAVVGLLLAIRFRATIQALIINAIFGLLVLAGANFVGAGVGISIWAVLICAIAGIPGAILVILLAYLEIAFVSLVVL